MAIRIAAHTSIFQQYGFDQAKQADKIADTIAEAGYDAVEWHPAAMVGDDYKNRLEHAQRNSGLELIGVSQTLPLWNQGEYERVMDILDDHAERLSSIDMDLTCNLACSGKANTSRNASQNEHLSQVLTELVSIFDSVDLKCAYQNCGESNESLEALAEATEDDQLLLSPDIHALHTGGTDPSAFLEANGDRIVSLHLRDYDAEGSRTVALGEGQLPFAGIKKSLEAIDFDGDLIVELILPSGTPPSRPVLEILQASRTALSEHLSI
jgi:sugar phosphate isomerase/epimerase